MFTIAQHIGIMETTKNTFRYLLLLLVIVGLGACSSTSNLPSDDVYYSSKTKNPTQYNWDDFQKSAQNQSANNVSRDNSTSGSTGYDSEYTTAGGSVAVADGNQSDEYEFIDEYYDSDYSSRISRFNGEGSSNDYYDDSYSSCGGCSSPNVSLSFGMGVGMGYGWGMSYGYGWPYYGYPYYRYPYYGWGYPYYGGSYWAGYNNGYWNGYWDGYYGGGGYYPGGGGYYPDYGYTSAYGPRGRGAGGSSIPRSGNGRSGSASNPSAKRITNDDNYVNRSGGYVASTGTSSKVYSAPRSGSKSGAVAPKARPEGSIRVADDSRKSTKPVRMDKPQQGIQNDPAKTNNRYRKPTTTREVKQRPAARYSKPKSYESLPSRQPRSSKEYVRPTTSNNRSNVNRSNTSTYNRSARQNDSRSNYSTTRNNPASSRSTVTRKRTSSTPKSYSSPSRSSNSSRSYSSPSRSYSSPSRSSSSGSGSRSSGSSSGGRSSSSGSRSGGGGRR